MAGAHCPFLPVTRDWCNRLLCFWTAACHSLQPAVKHVQRRVSQEWSLFVFKMILVLHSLSCFSLCFLWPCFILKACYRGQGGTCPHTLHSVLFHSQTMYWLLLSVTAPQNPCQSSSDWSVFVFWFEAGSEGTSVDCFLLICYELSECWLSFCVLSLCKVCYPARVVFCFWMVMVEFFVSLCLFFFFPERTFKYAEAVGEMKKMQMISTSRPAWHLLLSSWRQSGITDSGCSCSNINIYSQSGLEERKNVYTECSKPLLA